MEAQDPAAAHFQRKKPGWFTAHTAVEVGDEEKAPILRAYLKRWKAEVGVFFDGVGPDSPEEQLAAAAPKHPVFRLS